MKRKPDDEEVFDRPCGRPGCGNSCAEDWQYLWCPECCENGLCRHGNLPHDCNDCMIASDLAYDAARTAITPAQRSDEPAAE